MKSASIAYIAKEEAIQRKPVELYHLWNDNGDHWRYTSGDVSVDFDGETYLPATISRGSIRFTAQIDLTSLVIKFGYLDDPALEYIAINPIEGIWIEVSKLHRDMDPLEAVILFSGQLKTVSFKGPVASATCIGFEHFLKKIIPIWRYQVNCNHFLFDENCSLTKASYITSTTISLDATGLILTSSDFALQADGFFIRGEVIFGQESRTIVDHVGDVITLNYRMVTLIDGSAITAYPGCDGRIETCRDKFDNINNFLGFPFIPVDNPATRVSW